MWLYKVCKIHENKKTYTVVGRFEDKADAENARRQAEFFDRSHEYKVKRFSGEAGDIF